jgi:poly(3-hydroxybutyrate) depolymerase
MPFLSNQTLQQQVDRTYHVYVPDNPAGATVPAIVVFHGGGQDVKTIAARWGVGPGSPPSPLDHYLLIFPEADPSLGDEWVHFHHGDSAVPTHDLLFVDALLSAITDPAGFATGNPEVSNVTVDSDLLYAAGFSNGGGMVWQIMNSDRASRFQGFAAVGMALNPEKALQYRQQLGGVPPAPVPVVYVHGTGDTGFGPPRTLQEVPLDTTHPANTVREMLTRNLIPNAPNTAAVTRLEPGSTNITEVVVQLFQGGSAAFECVTVIGGGHNWPTPTTAGNRPVATHFNATKEIVVFWQNHAGLPI